MSGRVFYKIAVNKELRGYEDVVHILSGDIDDPLKKLEEIAKENETVYTDTEDNLIEITVFKVKEVYVIHKQYGPDSIEVYSNVIPVSQEEMIEYLRVSYDLHEEHDRRTLNVLCGSRLDKTRR